MIKRIELVNFMSHARTVIEPAAGLTVLAGPNNCGKSAVVAALQILAHNANSTYVRRHGEKTTEIIVETDDGHSITWSRSKNGSPKYLIDGQEFDRLKGAVPPLLDEILRLPKVPSDPNDFDIHFGHQQQPIFLLGDSGKSAAQFFASSSDAIRLVQMQDRHKSKVRESKRDHKRLKQESQQLELTIDVLSATEALEAELQKCEQEFANLNQCLETAGSLASHIDQIGQLTHRFNFQTSLADLLATVTTPPELAPTAILQKLTQRLPTLATQLECTSSLATTLSSLPTPPVLEPASALEQTIGSLVLQTSHEWVATKTAQLLKEVGHPPLLENEQEFECTLYEFSAALKQFAATSEQSRLLESLHLPPALQDEAQLETQIAELKKTGQQINQLDHQLTQLATQQNQTVEESKQWAIDHPVCPTCGANTDSNRLLASGGGCHAKTE